MGKLQFAEEILEQMFPSLSSDESGLKAAMSIAYPDHTVPDNAFKNILNSFEYISGKEEKFFLEGHKAWNERSNYKAKNQHIDWLKFEDFITLINDVVLFTQKFDPTLREIVREYYDSKGKRFENHQTYLNSRMGELAVSLIFDPNKIPESGSSWKAVARMKYPFCRRVLQAVFFDALGIDPTEIKCLNSNDSFEELIRGYLKHTEPGAPLCLSMYDYEGSVSSRGTKFYARSKVFARKLKKPAPTD